MLAERPESGKRDAHPKNPISTIPIRRENCSIESVLTPQLIEFRSIDFQISGISPDFW